MYSKCLKKWKQLAKPAALIAIILLLYILGATYLRYRIETNIMLAEAKNTEFALRILATEYYGMDRAVYDPLSPDGLVEGVQEEVAELSGAEGELILNSWDAARNAPRSFLYKKGKTVIFYHYEEPYGSCWDWYIQFRKTARPDWAEETMNPAVQ